MNQLAHETSPYLLQHAGNPVDWRPWGPEAFAAARERDCAVLVSIGYSACHWCHVMERESFEDAGTAALMNERFVCVKVDREERPDVDAIYMDALQAMTGQGGWPLNAFMTPDGVPFYAGTYFPREQWHRVLEGVAGAYAEQRGEIEAGRDQLVARLSAGAGLDGRAGALPDVVDAAVVRLRAIVDHEHGGWGGAPKFPAASTIEFLLGQGETAMSVHALRAMANGGIYDQIGGGFARYSTDAVWLVPHFEKMLYDNALLARAYLHGWQVTGDRLLRRVCEETLDFMLRELRQPEGGFASALDADSEGVEGKFYVWSRREMSDAQAAYFGVTDAGNWEGTNIPVRAAPDPPELAAWKAELLARREARVRPGLDDKRLTSWNALAVAALADASAALDRPDYVEAARVCADFLLTTMKPDRLLRTFNRGEARLPAYLEDHGYLLEALLTLYEATFEDRWFVAARALADETIFRFGDAERGGFFSTAHDHEALIARRKELEDTPIPSGQSAVAYGLLRLSALTGEASYREQAEAVLRPLGEAMERYPQAFGHLLQALAFARGPVQEVALVGDPGPFTPVLRAGFRPRTVVAASPAVPLMEGRVQPGAYVCEDFACRAPTADPDELQRMLR